MKNKTNSWRKIEIFLIFLDSFSLNPATIPQLTDTKRRTKKWSNNNENERLSKRKWNEKCFFFRLLSDGGDDDEKEHENKLLAIENSSHSHPFDFSKFRTITRQLSMTNNITSPCLTQCQRKIFYMCDRVNDTRVFLLFVSAFVLGLMLFVSDIP